MKNLYMHLTNVAIQKKNDKYDENTGMKWPISKLKQYLLSKHGLAATSKLFGDIQVHMLVKGYSILNYCQFVCCQGTLRSLAHNHTNNFRELT